MIITCPSCTIKFNVEDELIPTAGRKVRCSKCKNEWTVKKPTAKENEIDIDRFIHDNKPIVTPIREYTEAYYLRLFIAFLLMITLFTIVFVYYKDNVTSYLPRLTSIYNKIGYNNTAGIKFDDVTIQKILGNQGNFIIINGKMKNYSKQTLQEVYMRITLKDKEGNILLKQILPYTGSEKILPDQILNINYPMRIWFNHELINTVDLDIGSKFEFAFGLR